MTAVDEKLANFTGQHATVKLVQSLTVKIIIIYVQSCNDFGGC